MLRVAMAAIGLTVAVNAALGSDEREPEGWTIERAEGSSSCVVTGPAVREESISIVVNGSTPWLLMSAPEFSEKKEIKPVTLIVGGNRRLELNAQVNRNIYGLILTTELEKEIEGLPALTALIDGKTHKFQTPNLGSALDAAFQCAGMGTREDMRAREPRPIPDAGAWVISASMPPAEGCVVRRNNDEVNTSIVIDEKGQLLLTAGKPSWLAMPALVKIALQIDDGAPVDLQSGAFQNVFVTPLTDPLAVEKLSRAQTLTWYLPNGTYHAPVGGIGNAIDALRACNRTKRDASTEKAK